MYNNKLTFQRNFEKQRNEPSVILNQIRQKNLSAASNDHPSKPMSVVEKLFRADSSRGVIRTKVNNQIE